MSPKKKAEELVLKFMKHADKKSRPSAMGNLAMAQGSNIGGLLSNQSGVTYNIQDLLKSAKDCAVIAVEELINMAKVYDNHNVKTDKHIYTFECVVYWQEVLSEIKAVSV